MNIRDRRAPLPLGLGHALEPFYRAALARRNRIFDRGRGVTRLDVPVISVGNLSVGGTGKTPTVSRLVQWLIDAGASPAIAMRGYRAAPGEKSDEEQHYATSFPGLPIVAQPDRLAGLAPLIRGASADCVVLDDGFQHRRIARDLDIVLLDASRDVMTGRCLPAGWLREPPASLTRAGAVILTHCELVTPDELERQSKLVREIAGDDIIIARARHTWTAVLTPEGPKNLEAIKGARAVVACGIGHPLPFVRMAREHGVEVIREVIKPDHHRWTRPQFDALIGGAGASIVLTTSKDWATMSRVAPDKAPIWRPSLEIGFDSGETPLREVVLAQIRHRADQAPLRGTISARG